MDKPTSNLEWATAGTKTEPGPSMKEDGFRLGDFPDEENINYLWDAQKDFIDWLGGQVAFVEPSDIYDAIVSTAPLDLVKLGFDQDWRDSGVTKDTHGAVTHLCTDGRRLYYGVHSGPSTIDVYAANARCRTDPDIAWTRTGLGVGYGNIKQLSTDGQIVVVLAYYPSLGTTSYFSVLDAATGAIIHQEQSSIISSSSTNFPKVIADSNGVDQRFWVANGKPGGSPFYRWTLSGGFVGSGLGGLPDIAEEMAVTQSYIVVFNLDPSGDIRGRWYSKDQIGTPARISNEVGLTYSLGSILWAYGRDDDILIGYQRAEDSPVPLQTFIRAGWLASESVATGGAYPELGPLNDPGPCVFGDGYFYSRSRIFDEDGIVVYERSSPIDGDFSLGGQHLWCVIGGSLVALPTQMRQGDLWLRKSDCSDGLFNGRSQAGMRLLTKMEVR